jgi:non-ribosomal peptide synthetase component F
MSLPLPDDPVAPVLDRIDAYLDHWAAIHPDSEFLIDGGPSITGRRLTWAQTRAAVDSVASALMAAGMQRGDRVAYLSDSPRLLRPLPGRHQHRPHLAGPESQVHVERGVLRRR